MGCRVSVDEAWVSHIWHEHIKHMNIHTLYTKRDPYMPQESSKRDLYVILLMGCECWWSICHANVTWTYQTYEYWYPYIPQETYKYQKRPKHAKRVVKRGLYMIVLMGLCCEWYWSICDMKISNLWILTPIHIKRDPYIRKESLKTVLYISLPMGCVVSVPEAFVTHMWHEHIKRMKIDTHTYQKRPIYIKRDQYIPKETHIYQERPMYTKRDSYIPKETHIYQKRHTYTQRSMYTKRDPCTPKETHIYQKTQVYQTSLPHPSFPTTHTTPHSRSHANTCRQAHKCHTGAILQWSFACLQSILPTCEQQRVPARPNTLIMAMSLSHTPFHVRTHAGMHARFHARTHAHTHTRTQ